MSRIPEAAAFARDMLLISGPVNEIERLSRFGARCTEKDENPSEELKEVVRQVSTHSRSKYETCAHCGREFQVTYIWGTVEDGLGLCGWHCGTKAFSSGDHEDYTYDCCGAGRSGNRCMNGAHLVLD